MVLQSSIDGMHVGLMVSLLCSNAVIPRNMAAGRQCNNEEICIAQAQGIEEILQRQRPQDLS